MQRGESKTILLVEDDASTALLQKKKLQEKGYNVHHASSGEIAVTTILQNLFPIDLVLMDIDLGSGIDGTQAASQILLHADIPIVFLSSHTESEIVEKTEQITSYGYVVKNSGIVVLDASIKMAFKLFDAKAKEQEKEKSLRKSENFLARTGEMAKVGGWEMDLEKNKAIWTQTAANIHELPEVRELDLGKAFSFFHPEDGQASQDCVTAAIKADKSFEFEARIITAKGNIRWIRSFGQPQIINEKCTHLSGIVQDITERKLAEEEIQKQLCEKATLLREIHHRVKNNIGNFESLLTLQMDSNSNSEVKSALQTAISHISSWRILYEKLLNSENYKDLNSKEYIENLIDSIAILFPISKKIVFEKQIIDLKINSNKLITIGITLNEILTNAFKYAFTGKECGTLFVSLSQTDTQLILSVKDNGVGFGSGINENSSSGFGLNILKMFSDSCSIDHSNGTSITLLFDI